MCKSLSSLRPKTNCFHFGKFANFGSHLHDNVWHEESSFDGPVLALSQFTRLALLCWFISLMAGQDVGHAVSGGQSFSLALQLTVLPACGTPILR
jgi:hypothetical protein